MWWYFLSIIVISLAQSGLTLGQILRAATSDAARAMRVEGVGTIMKGAWADFVVLNGKPLPDIHHTRSIAAVWFAGHQVKR